MCKVYMFEATVTNHGRGRVVLYPPKEYQERLKKHQGKKVKVMVVIESD